MPLLTTAQLHQIRDTIRDHHTAFVINTIGPSAVPADIVAKLRAKGMIVPAITTIEDAYLYGQVLAAMDNPATAAMTFDQFKEHVRKNPIPLTAQENRSIDIAKNRAAQYAVGLGNRIDVKVGAMVMEVDSKLERERRDAIRDKVSENIAKREAIQSLVSDLKWATKDWARDWNRIAVTEKHNAMQEGMADHWGKRFGSDVRVAKRPMPDACDKCKDLHLGSDGQPIIFKLSDLERNGTNVGKKKKAWQPVVGAVHPHCQCQLIRIPEGWGFDTDGSLIPGGDLGKSYDNLDDYFLARLQEQELRKGAAQGHVTFQGIPITIETKKGQTRHWETPEGERGTTRMAFAYGFVDGTQDADQGAVDCYVGPDPRAELVYVVHQLDPVTDRHDESKCFLGFGSAAAARVAYAFHHDKADLAFGGMTSMTVDQFKRWVAGTEPTEGHMMKSVYRGKGKRTGTPGDYRYSYDEPEPRFSSPMVHDANQDDLDGSFTSGKYNNLEQKVEILKRVTKGTKPFGSIVGDPEDIKPLHRLAKKQKHLLVSKLDRGYIEGHVSFTVSVKGKLSDHFDMEALAETYERNGLPGVAQHIRNTKNKSFKAYHGRLNWDIGEWKPGGKIATQGWETGLILGFPVENTLKRIYGVKGKLKKSVYRGKGKRTGTPGNYEYTYAEPVKVTTQTTAALTTIAGEVHGVETKAEAKALLDKHGVKYERVIGYHGPKKAFWIASTIPDDIPLSLEEERAAKPLPGVKRSNKVTVIKKPGGKGPPLQTKFERPKQAAVPRINVSQAVARAFQADGAIMGGQDAWSTLPATQKMADKIRDKLLAARGSDEFIDDTFSEALWAIEGALKKSGPKLMIKSDAYAHVRQSLQHKVRRNDLHLVLQKGEARGGKYLRRVPYTDGKGKRRYRYYYAESAMAREAVAGEEIKLGDRVYHVEATDRDGNVTLSWEGGRMTLSPDQWHDKLVEHYGDRFQKSAERRARQAVNAVLRHVPRELLTELKGDTDAERLADLQVRVPAVYDKLQKAFRRAGISPFGAQRILTRTLERRGWAPEARAAVIGSVLRDRALPLSQVISGAENLAAGGSVGVRHVATVTELRAPGGNAGNFNEGSKRLAKAAETELAQLSATLAQVAKGEVPAAEALAAALSSAALQKLNMLTKAFPGLVDRVTDEARDIMPEIASHAPGPPKTQGAGTVVYVAGKGGAPEALKATFKLVEAEDLIASHTPESFTKREGYPAGLQERAYHRDKAEQAKVIRNAERFNPRFVINTNPDAVNGPPLVTDDGVVLGGNSRAMSMQRVYRKHPDKAEELKRYLVEHGREVGFSEADINAMKQPVLIREVTPEDKSFKNLKLLVRQMNETFTQAMDPRTMQVAQGRKLDDKTLLLLAEGMDADQTLSSFLASPKADRFINALFDAGIIDSRNSNQYIRKGTKKLNADGVTLVNRIMVGRVVGDADVLSDMGSQMVESLGRSIPSITQAMSAGKGYDLRADLKVAIDAFNDLQRKVDDKQIDSLRPKMDDAQFRMLFDSFAGLPGMESHPILKNDRASQLLEVLVRKRGLVQMSQVFRAYSKAAEKNPEGQATMFGTVSPTEVLRDTLDTVFERTKKSLTVSGQVATEMGGQTSPANWRNPGHGTMVNFMEGNIGRHKPETHPAVEGWDPGEQDPKDLENRKKFVNADDYLGAINDPGYQVIEYDLETQLDTVGGHPTSAEAIDINAMYNLREYVDRETNRQRMRPRNHTDPKKSKPDKETKQ